MAIEPIVTQNDSVKQEIVPFEGQFFSGHTDWVRYATSALTAHENHNNTEHSEDIGWRGHHFTAMCYDQKNVRCRNGRDFKDASYPVWWVWPDQIPELVSRLALSKGGNDE